MLHPLIEQVGYYKNLGMCALILNLIIGAFTRLCQEDFKKRDFKIEVKRQQRIDLY